MIAAIGSICLAIGLVGCWLDIASNGAREAEWAGLMLSLATLGAVLLGIEYLRN